MNAIDRPTAPQARVAASGGRPCIYYADPLRSANAGDVNGWLAEAASLGFTTVLIPPIWRPGAQGDRFDAASLEHGHPALGDGFLADYVSGCRAHGLQPLMDVVLGHVAAEFDETAPEFEPGRGENALDPRRLGRPRRRPARNGPEAGANLAAWWARRVAAWAEAGLAGLRLLDLDTVDAAPIIAAIRAVAPSLTLIAWTPGLLSARLAGLRGVDYVVSSLPWWDLQSPWLWDELDRLRAIAPVLGCPEAPFGARVAASVSDPARIAPALRRAAATAAALSDGWIVPAGFATGARRRLDERGQTKAAGDEQADISSTIALINQGLQAPFPTAHEQPLTGPGEPVLAVLRTDHADARFARHAHLHMVNTDLLQPVVIDPSRLLSAVDGSFGPFEALRESGPSLVPGTPVTLQPGACRSYAAARRSTADDRSLDQSGAQSFADGARVAIEAPSPCVDDGLLPAKRLAGEVITISADVICDGHDTLAAVLRWRGPGQTAWSERRMRSLGNDRFGADLVLDGIGSYEYSIQAWRDAYGSYRYELAKKVEAGLDVSLELREGAALVERTARRAPSALSGVTEALKAADQAGQKALLLSPELAERMALADDRPRAAALPHPIRISAERSGAAFAAWYEVFPRSMSDDPERHGTFSDVERHLPRVKAMGFDVLYFPPIHPIGRTNRKGANNTLTPSETDPGSPYAIGSAEGGHDALHPELGSFDDFHHLIAAAAGHGLEVAIDFAIQCSPDHPWLREHRDWFEWRPDGSIRYAENPPKKYQDIVNVDFYASGAIPGLWAALANVVLFWCKHGVRLFRVDNPHTKPFPFWQWMIAEVRARYPDAVFLAEAFTRPKVMYRLAKVGFSQSYTYFTWRESKREMEAYLTELAEPGPREFFRPHFFVNTPDINPVYLQGAPRAAYVIRAALAATLSGLWGVYSGFELCEGTPVPGREEYLDSEKYQIRAWDWDRPGHIVADITALNRIRRLNPALRSHLNTVFLPSGNDAVTVFEKATPDRGNVVVTAISFDPNQAQETAFEFPFWHWGVSEQSAFDVQNLVTGERTVWRGKAQSVRLTPDAPYAVWCVRPVSSAIV